MLFECSGRPWKYLENGRRGDPNATPKEPISGAEWASAEAEFWIHEVCNGSQLLNCSNRNEIYSFHPGGANFLYGDGSVHFHSETIDAEYILAYCARALVDPETHARVFVTDEQLGQLKAMPGGITKVFNEACDLNYDSKDAAEGLVKNSEETAGDDSGSGSRSTAASVRTTMTSTAMMRTSLGTPSLT